MGYIKITFEGDGAGFDAENICVMDILKAISLLAHEAKEHGGQKGHILAATIGGVEDEVFNRMTTTAEPIGGGVAISHELADLLRGFNK